MDMVMGAVGAAQAASEAAGNVSQAAEAAGHVANIKGNMTGPGAMVMQREDPFFFDELGFARLQVLRPNGCRTRTYNSLVSCRMIAVCCLDQILPYVKEPMFVQPAVNFWEASVQVDEIISTLFSVSPLKGTGDMTDLAFKACLLMPFCPEVPMSVLYAGQTDFVLPKPKISEDNAAMDVAKAMLTTQIKDPRYLFIQDDRGLCPRMCGSKKGQWSIYSGEKKIARIHKPKTGGCLCCCKKKPYLVMEDMDGNLIARQRITPTCSQCMNQTCRKCTCQCCCLCRICDCIRCKCLITDPVAKIQAPGSKQLMKVYNRGACCKAAKGKIEYPTMYIPGQDGADDDEDGAKIAPEDDKADEPEDEGEAPKGKDMYNVTCGGPDKGKPGKKVKYYIKKPPYCGLSASKCVGLSRDIKRITGLEGLEDLKQMLDNMGQARKPPPQMKDYKKVKHDCFDIQYGQNFTTAQKAGAMLFWLNLLSQRQY